MYECVLSPPLSDDSSVDSPQQQRSVSEELKQEQVSQRQYQQAQRVKFHAATPTRPEEIPPYFPKPLTKLDWNARSNWRRGEPAVYQDELADEIEEQDKTLVVTMRGRQKTKKKKTMQDAVVAAAAAADSSPSSSAASATTRKYYAGVLRASSVERRLRERPAGEFLFYYPSPTPASCCGYVQTHLRLMVAYSGDGGAVERAAVRKSSVGERRRRRYFLLRSVERADQRSSSNNFGSLEQLVEFCRRRGPDAAFQPS